MLPRWSARLGAPFIEGFRIECDGVGGPSLGVDFTNAYFQSAVRLAAEKYVVDGSLRGGERFFYLVLALPVDSGPEDAPAGGRLPLKVRRQAVTLPMVESSLARMRAGTVSSGDHDPADLPVFLPADLLQEVMDLSRSAQVCECGGVLVGHLHRDPGLPELFVEVTAQVPARHVEASAHRLTFTAETWREVNAALALRASGEIMLGWWHSHPVGTWCQGCPPEKRSACAPREGFLSAHDRLLQRTVFPGAHCVALVVTDTGLAPPRCTLFGWRRGAMVPRGHFVRPPGTRLGGPLDGAGQIHRTQSKETEE
jgi:proteasome lid subunit RPN8/RPN11